jgi:uncharacterized RDD family membrane protein YckC
MSLNIFVSVNGERRGPLDQLTLNQEVAAKRISLNDLAWVEGQKEWKPLAQIPEAMVAVMPPLPALPTQNGLLTKFASTASSVRELKPRAEEVILSVPTSVGTLDPLPESHVIALKCPGCAGDVAVGIARCVQCGIDLKPGAGSIRYKRITLDLHARRFLAFLADVLILIIPLGIIASLLSALFLWAAILGYFLGFEMSGWQATPGKRLLRLKVVDARGERISFAQAFGRAFVFVGVQFVFWQSFSYFGLPGSGWMLGFVFWISSLAAIFSAVHDLSSKTFVVRRSVVGGSGGENKIKPTTFVGAVPKSNAKSEMPQLIGAVVGLLIGIFLIWLVIDSAPKPEGILPSELRHQRGVLDRFNDWMLCIFAAGCCAFAGAKVVGFVRTRLLRRN